MPISSNMDTSARKSLPQAADVWVNRARGKAKTTRMRNSFEIGSVVSEGEGRYSITIKNTAPEAPAYEFGSGLTSTKKPPARILIKSKTGKILHFNMPEALNLEHPKVKPDPKTGEVFLPQVLHPGVRPEPFMKPAFEEVKGQMRQIIGRSFAVEVVHKSILEMWKVD